MGEAPEEIVKQDALLFLKEDYPIYWQDKSKVEMAASLMEDAAAKRKDKLAGELWKIRCLMIPFRHPDKFLWSDGSKKEITTTVSTLKQWMDKFMHPSSRAQAGYEAAKILQERSEKIDLALTLCGEVEERFQETQAAKKCRKLVATIKMPRLNLEVQPGPPQGSRLFVTSSNLKKVYFSLYKTSPKELMQLNNRYSRNEPYWSYVLNQPDQELIKQFIRERKPVYKWETDIQLPKPASLYLATRSKAPLPKINFGIYLVVASGDSAFKAGEALLSGAIINATNFILMGTSGIAEDQEKMIFVPGGPKEHTANTLHFYIIDPVTGKAVGNAKLNIQLRKNGLRHDTLLYTGNDGLGHLPTSFSLIPGNHTAIEVDPLAEHGNSFAYWSNPVYVDFAVPSSIQLFIETDRPIYRPGQTVSLKVTAITRIQHGYKPGECS